MSSRRSAPEISGQRIVVLDSNPILVSVTGVLRMSGYCVFSAYDGQAAQELCCSLPAISLLVLNTHVDGMDEAVLFRAIRARCLHLPILHVDTHRGPLIPEDIPTLTEPFTGEALLEAVAGLLAQPSGAAGSPRHGATSLLPGTWPTRGARG